VAAVQAASASRTRLNIERLAMKIRLKKLHDQTIVITGATSGIGLTTARMAAQKGARLLLAARSSDALTQLAAELRRTGAVVSTVTADVGVEADVARIASTALEHFGHFDTWVNNAGISVYGRIEEVDTEDMRRLFDTNFWGVVYGSLQAVRHFRERGAGALINLGSELSEAPIALQGLYAASKHAVKGFTNSLRVETEMEHLPVSVTLVKPAGIDTMFTIHAKNYMDKEPALPPPIYAPEAVAEAILRCAEYPQREVFVGAAAKVTAASAYHTPRLLDVLLRTVMARSQKESQSSAHDRHDALHSFDPNTELRQRSGKPISVHETSAYTRASLAKPPLKKALIVGGILFAAWSLAKAPHAGTGDVAQLSA
jgi:short-subunit dehydrogenase